MSNLDYFVNILSYAKERNATDIHITAGAVPAMRVEGKLSYIPFETVFPKDTENILNELLNEEQKNILRASRYLSLPLVIKDIGRLRANVYMQRGSFSINFRILDRLLKTAEELGIPDVVMNLYQKKSGLILICGNRNSGISATRAFIIKKISESRECLIITIEDPIEYLFKHDKSIVNQKEIGIDVNSFQEGVYSAMTQDPDVIMISFSGDPDIFSAALTAAENGHLVIASLHTVGSVKTIRYIIEMFPVDKRNNIKMRLYHTLQAIISQQMIPTKDEKGTIPAMEIVLATSAVKNLIIENKIYQIPDVIKASKSLGMITIEDYVNSLYSRGLISKESALSFSHNQRE
jgi:twitching motility protein PilT